MLKNSKYFDLPTGPVISPFLLLGVLLLSGCSGHRSPDKPSDLIPEDQYIDLLAEMQHIQSYRNAEPDSVNADSLKTVVLKSYNVTDSQFLATHKYYQLQPDRHLEQIDSVLKVLDEEELRIRSFIDSVQSQRQKKDTLETTESEKEQSESS